MSGLFLLADNFVLSFFNMMKFIRHEDYTQCMKYDKKNNTKFTKKKKD